MKLTTFSLCFSFCLLLAGCQPSTPLSNKEIISLYNECKSAGLGVEQLQDTLGRIYAVQCDPNGVN